MKGLKKMIRELIVAVFILTGMHVWAQSPFFDSAQTQWCIKVPENPSDTELFAIKELQQTLKKISNADFPAVRQPFKEINVIILGTPASSSEIKRHQVKLQLTDGVVEEVAVKNFDGKLYLAGNNPRGCLYAVYSFLQEQLGVRWLWGGDDGEFIVKRNKYSLPNLDYFYRPCFRYRSVGGFFGKYGSEEYKKFAARNFINSGLNWFQKEHRKYGFDPYGCCHSVFLDQKLFKSKPEMFCFIDGKRLEERDSRGCYSNPETLKYMVEKHIGLIQKYGLELLYAYPSDNGNYCQCTECAKNPDIPSRWFLFYAKMCKEIRKEFPTMRFATIAYQEYAATPQKKVDEIIESVGYCQYDRCYVHSLANPSCKINASSLKRLKQWQEKAPCGIYGYEFDIFKPAVYPPFLNMLADEMKIFKKLEIKDVYAEAVTPVNLDHLKMATWIYRRLAWNPDQSVEKLLRDWCQTVYGPAAEPIINYHQMMINAWDKMDTHLTYVYNNPIGTAKYFLNQKMIADIHKQFSAAEKIVKDISEPAERKRILAHLNEEKKCFAEWEKAYNLSNENITLVAAPFSDDSKKAAILPMKSQGGEHQATEATVHYDNDNLYFNLICHENNMSGLEKSGNNCFGRDTIEVIIDPNDGKSYRHFAFGSGGCKYFSVGGKKEKDTAWAYSIKELQNCWTVRLTIPFKTIGVKPKENDTWRLGLNRNGNMKGGKGESCGYPIPLYNDISSAGILSFTKQVHPERRLIWYNTQFDGRFGAKALFSKLHRNGWSFQMATAKGKNIQESNLVLIRTIQNPIPIEHYQNVILPHIRNGAVLVFDAYAGVEFEKIFNDHSWKLRFQESRFAKPKEGRFANMPFLHTPHDLKKIIHTGWMFPVNCHIPQNPTEWIFLAELKMKNGQWQPCILMRKYGKGLVIVSGAMNPDMTIPMITNVLDYYKKNQ